MNIHHLELFYHVARNGGIAEAVRKMPYGIQQPAISSQIIQLEETLGAPLFRRRPFALTESGRELFRFIEPFFANLETTTERLRRGGSQNVRIGASQTVLRDYLPEVLEDLRKTFPRLRVRLREGFQHELVRLVQAAEIDVAVTSLNRRPPAGLKCVPLIELPLILLAPRSSPLRSAAELWQRDRLDETLISLPPDEAMCRAFNDEMARRRVDWFTGIEVSSLQLVAAYVERGFGLGLSVAEPRVKLTPGVRALPLDDFPCVTYGLISKRRLSSIAGILASTMIERARRFRVL